MQRYILFLFLCTLSTSVWAQPIITNDTVTPAPIITFFGSYIATADVDPNGNSIDSVYVYTEVINGDGGDCSAYYTDGVCYSSDSVGNRMLNSTGNTWEFDEIRPDNIYPYVLFAPAKTTVLNSPETTRVRRTDYHIMHYTNPYTMSNNSSFFIEVNASPRSQRWSADMQVYLVGKDKDITFFQSDWMSSADVQLVGSINKDQDYNHQHTSNSEHHVIRLATNADGTVGSKSIDISGDYWVVLYVPTYFNFRSWNLRYHDKDKNNNRDNNNTWYKGSTSGWSTELQSGLPDVHTHLVRSGTIKDSVEVETVVYYNGGSTTSISTVYPFASIENLPPNASALIDPLPCRYNGLIDISWAPATDPNNDAVTYNAYLVNANDQSTVKTIVEGTASTSVSSFSIADVDDGVYDIKVQACDAEFCTDFYWSGSYGGDGDSLFVVANDGVGLFRTRQSGDWDSNTTWEVYDGSCNWQIAGAGQYPDATFEGTVFIQQDHTVSLTANQTATSVSVISDGGVLNTSTYALDLGSSYFTGDKASISGSGSISFGELSVDTLICSGSPEIKISGDWTSLDYTPANATITFEGSSEQVLSGCDEIYNLTVNNTGAGLDLTESVTINGTLTLTDGLLKVSSGETLITSDVSGGNLDSYVVTNSTHSDTNWGGLQRSVEGNDWDLFPVGTSAAYAPVELRNDGAATDVKIRAFENMYAYGVSGDQLSSEESVNQTWQINPSGTPTLDIKLTWHSSQEDASLPDVFDRDNARIAKVTGEPYYWHWISTSDLSVDEGNGYYSRTVYDVSSFSKFGVGSGNSALPVELLSFTANLKEAKTLLEWTTASEFNNDKFEVQRLVEHAADFLTIGEVFGAGNSENLLRYYFTDENPLPGLNYYRLKQVDFDGSFAYSRIQAVNVSEIHGKELLTCRKESSFILIDIKASIEGEGYLQLLDSKGKLVQEKLISTKSGLNQTKISVADLPRGVYCVRFVNAVEIASCLILI